MSLLPGSRGYTYDHNGNRLTQTMNGSAYQGFTYDAHDKMTSGTSGNETPHFDPNGNETGTTINGGTWVDTYDDEDRLVSVAVPGGPTDTFTYNGLGLRVGKTDSTGTYSYVCDGTSPGSPILSDGQAVYTPGLSERRNGASLFYNSDNLGNLWSAEDGTGQAEAGAFLFTGFGAPLYTGSGSANASPLKYGGANDCQTDADTGLVLMGHRYYDTRTGRFISQDPVGDGDNWYAYADNSPTNNVDPTGLVCDPFYCPGMSFDDIEDHVAQNGGIDGEEYTTTDGHGGSFNWTFTGASFANSFMQGGMGLNMGNPGGGMIAASGRDRKMLRGLAEEAGYNLGRIGKHEIWTKPGKPPVRMPNDNHNEEKRVVDGLKKRFEKEILENEQEEVNDAEPSETQKFWASRTDGQLVAGSILLAGAIVGSFFIPSLSAVAAPVLVVAP